MKQICSITNQPFLVSEAEAAYCKENALPLPIINPRHRLRGMLIYRNRNHLWHTKCAHSDKPVLTCIPPKTNHTVYDVDLWESDEWDALAYGREYNFQRPFFEQFADLFAQVPLPNLAVIRSLMENSDYTNGITGAKNCYLIFSSSMNEDSLFSKSLWRCTGVVDCVYAFDCELCYDCVDIRNCYNLRFSNHCSNCTDSQFLFNCHSCSNCFGCTNLSNKKHHLYNKQLSKEEYERRVAELNTGSRTVVALQKKKLALTCKESSFLKYYFGTRNESSFGNFIFGNKNCKNCHFVSNSEDVENSIYLDDAKSCFTHAMFGNKAELIYNSVSCGDNVYNLRFCNDCWQGSHDLEYCMFCCYGTAECFGCVGTKRKSHCILNKQYSAAEYHELRRRIVEHMKSTGEYGQFFPASLSPHAYNQCDAIEFLPLSKEPAEQLGFRWAEEEQAQSESTVELPDHIKDVTDDILDNTLVCEQSGKQYKIIRQELDYYRRQNLPPPATAPLERIRQRTSIFRVRPMRRGQCPSCDTPFLSVYDGDKQRVLCEDCFLKKMY